MAENMVKSVTKYLRDNLSTTIYPGHLPSDRDVTNVLVRETGGDYPYIGIDEDRINFMSESTSYMDARTAVYDVLDLIKSKEEGVILPAGETGDDAIQTEMIEILSKPTYVSVDEMGRHRFTMGVAIRR